MWQILKTELQYAKVAMAVNYLLGVLLLIFAINWDMDGEIEFGEIRLRFFVPNFVELYTLMANTMTLAIIVFVILGVQIGAEKRVRLYARLPMPIKAIGVARLLPALCFQAGIMLLWLILFWVEPPAETGKALFTMVGVAALFLGVLLIVLLWFDLGAFGTRKFQMVLLAGICLTALGYLWFIFHRFDEISEQQVVDRLLFYRSPAGAVFVSAAFIGLLWLSVRVFAKRKSYLV